MSLALELPHGAWHRQFPGHPRLRAAVPWTLDGAGAAWLTEREEPPSPVANWGFHGGHRAEPGLVPGHRGLILNLPHGRSVLMLPPGKMRGPGLEAGGRLVCGA